MGNEGDVFGPGDEQLHLNEFNLNLAMREYKCLSKNMLSVSMLVEWVYTIPSSRVQGDSPLPLIDIRSGRG